MYKRDFGIIVLAVFAIYWSLQHEGTYQYSKAFYYRLQAPEELVERTHPVPDPVVADLNGDGVKEVVVVTHDLELHLIRPSPASRYTNGFAPATVKSMRRLSPVLLEGSRTPVALSVGYIDPPNQSASRKMVIVVVTAGWIVVCLDHNLNVKWQLSLRERFPHNSVIREMAIHISHHQVTDRDRGMVVIAGSVEYGHLGTDSWSTDTLQKDEIDEELDLLDEEELKGHDGTKKTAEEKAADENKEDEPKSDGAADQAPGLSRHFQFHALEAGAGHHRWTSTGQDFHYDLHVLQQQTIPQHNYRLDAAALEGHQYGAVSCRDYRESIVKALPHSWRGLRDTQLRAARFVKHKQARGAARKDLAKGHRAAQGAGHAAKLGEAVGKRDSAGGLTGVAGGEKGGKIAGPHQPPNVLVAYSEQGIEVVNLFSGAPVCKLSLPPHTLHTDLNGDGVLDQILATDDRNHLHAGHHSHAAFKRCHLYVHSGYPATTPLFNGTLCRSGATSAAGRTFGVTRGVGAPLEILVPVSILAPSGTAQALKKSVVVALNNRGEVTTFGAAGGRRWQRQTAATWVNYDHDSHGQRVEATLLPLPMQLHAQPTAVLVAGTHTATVLSLTGTEMDSFDLPEPPAAPLVRADFSGDGHTDVILVASQGIYGFQLVKHLGAGMPYATLLAGLLMAVIVVYVTQQGPTVKHKMRSTDRVE